MEILAVIPARGGSRGIPRKNLQPLDGKPLIWYSIEAARQARRLDHIVVSTEDEEIMAVAKQFGVDVIKRPEEFATDLASIDGALRHAVREFEQDNGKIDFVVVLYANVPVRSEAIIDKVINTFVKSSADSAQTYAPYPKPPQWAFKIEESKAVPLDGCHVSSYRRQDLTPAYYPDGAVLMLRRDILMQSKEVPVGNDSYQGRERLAIIQAPEDTVDVDNSADLLWAEFILDRLKSTKDKMKDCELK